MIQEGRYAGLMTYTVVCTQIEYSTAVVLVDAPNEAEAGEIALIDATDYIADGQDSTDYVVSAVSEATEADLE